MAKGQLFKLFLQTIHSLSPVDKMDLSIRESFTAVPESNPEAKGNKTPYNLIAVIDDEDIFRDQWPAFLKTFDTVCYATAEDFVKEWDHVGGRLFGVLTDKYLGSGMDGTKLGTMLRQKAPDLAIILSTSDMSVKNDSNIFDLIVEKDAYEEAPKITKYLEDKAKNENLPARMHKTIRSFDSQVRNVGDQIEVESTIDLHLRSWKFLIKESDESTEENLKQSLTKMDLDKMMHDIKASISRLKILLRKLESGEMELKATMDRLRSRVKDLAKM